MKKREPFGLLVLDHSTQRSLETIRSLRSAFTCDVLFASSSSDAMAVLRQHHPPVAVVASDLRTAEGVPITRFIQEISPETGVVLADDRSQATLRAAQLLEGQMQKIAKVAEAMKRNRIFRRH